MSKRKMKNSSVTNLPSSIKKTGWEFHGLRGKVKEHYMIVYDIKGNAGADVKEIRMRAVFKFDKKGNRTECEYSEASGALLKKYIAQYDGKCNQIEGAWYNADGTLSRKDIFGYDSRGNQIEKAKYSADGVLLNRTTYKYDANGMQIEEVLCNIDDSFKMKGVNKYDTSGKLIETEYFNEDGSTNSKINFMNDIKESSEKDEMGNTIEEARYDEKGTLTRINISSYTYY